ncbi:hypothetical protein [Haliangium sp.]|uniref:hypothetical protein n=1 Tax=Haliangium sp. TaxID=2663208 RepID=UPI003D0CA8ED
MSENDEHRRLRASANAAVMKLGSSCTVEQAIAHTRAWLDELRRGGFAELIERSYGADAQVIEPGPGGYDEVRLQAVEAELGLALPPSYRRFLHTSGQVTFLNSWRDQTTALEKLVERSRALETGILEIHARSPLVRAMGDQLRVIRFCDYQNYSGEWMYLANARDAYGESPALLWFKSPKLAAARDQFIGTLRRDGRPGHGRLPALASRPRESRFQPRLFDTFESWLAGHTETLIEGVANQLAAGL